MEDLDKLAADFAARGYEADGAELDVGEPAAGHGHGHAQPAATHGHGTVKASAGSRIVDTKSRSPPVTR